MRKTLSTSKDTLSHIWDGGEEVSILKSVTVNGGESLCRLTMWLHCPDFSMFLRWREKGSQDLSFCFFIKLKLPFLKRENLAKLRYGKKVQKAGHIPFLWSDTSPYPRSLQKGQCSPDSSHNEDEKWQCWWGNSCRSSCRSPHLTIRKLWKPSPLWILDPAFTMAMKSSKIRWPQEKKLLSVQHIKKGDMADQIRHFKRIQIGVSASTARVDQVRNMIWFRVLWKSRKKQKQTKLAISCWWWFHYHGLISLSVYASLCLYVLSLSLIVI